MVVIILQYVSVSKQHVVTSNLHSVIRQLYLHKAGVGERKWFGVSLRKGACLWRVVGKSDQTEQRQSQNILFLPEIWCWRSSIRCKIIIIITHTHTHTNNHNSIFFSKYLGRIKPLSTPLYLQWHKIRIYIWDALSGFLDFWHPYVDRDEFRHPKSFSVQIYWFSVSLSLFS